MRFRLFSVPEGTATWRVLTALVLVFLPFSLFSAGLLTLTRIVFNPGGASVGESLHILGSVLSSGILHELGHWAAAGPGVRISAITTTPGMATVRIRFSPEPAAGSPRWVRMMLGGAAANLLLAGTLLALHPRLGTWAMYYIFLHLLTAGLNLVPFRTAATGPTDGWLLWQGLRGRLAVGNGGASVFKVHSDHSAMKGGADHGEGADEEAL